MKQIHIHNFARVFVVCCTVLMGAWAGWAAEAGKDEPRVEKAQATVVQDAASKDWFVTATAVLVNPGAVPAWRSLRLSVVDDKGTVVQTFKHVDVDHGRVCYDCHGGEVAAGGRKEASLKVRLAEKKAGYQVRLTLADSSKKILQTVLVPLTEKK